MKKYLLSALMIVVIGAMSALRAEVYYKEIKKNFAVNRDVKLDMDVSFANVNIQTWDQSQMEIIIKMDISAKNEERANEYFESFNVDIDEGMDIVNLNIEAGDWNSSKSESFSVHVEIRMPAAASLHGECAFGDLTISDLTAICDVNIEYGNLKINGLWSYENNVRNSFGNATINGTNGGEFNNEYGMLTIGLLQGNAKVQSSFGNLEIKKIAMQCKDLEVGVEYADAHIDLSSDAGFRFDLSSSYGNIDLPSSAKTTSSESDFQDKQVKGTIGNGEGKLEVKCEFGNVDIDVISK